MKLDKIKRKNFEYSSIQCLFADGRGTKTGLKNKTYAGCGHYTSLYYKEHLFTITLCGKLPKVLGGVNRKTCKNKPLMKNSAKI